jgi:hypothetical protein
MQAVYLTALFAAGTLTVVRLLSRAGPTTRRTPTRAEA